MAATLVPTVRTQYSQVELTKALIEGWIDAFGTKPTKNAIAVLWAQNAIETGLTVSMWNNNIGNVKYVANRNDPPTVEYCMLKNTWEIVNGKRVTFQPPHPATWFRSFKTLKDGVRHHLAFLRNNRYRNAWPSVVAGDPAEFSRQLRKSGYYTAPEAAYIKAMNGYYNKFLRDKFYENALDLISKQATSTNPDYTPGTGSSSGTSSGVIHPPIDFERPLEMPAEKPLTLSPWQKFQSFVSGIFKK